MKKTSFTIVLVALVLVLSGVRSKAELRLQHEHLTTQNGLSNNSVRYMMQDSKGFIWMSTLNGLSRYDGNSFVNYFPTDQKPSLADSRINRLQEDYHEHLWITTFGDKVSCYDLRKGKFVDFTGEGAYDQNYGMVTIADNGDVWLWSRGRDVRRVSFEGDRFVSQTFDQDSGTLPSNTVLFLLAEGASGFTEDVWVGTDKGLSRFKDGRMRVVDNSGGYVAGCDFGQNAIFIKEDGTVMMSQGGSDTITSIGKVEGVRSRNDLTGKSPVSDDIWLVLTSTGGYEINHRTSKVTRARAEWDIPRGIITNDNKGHLWIHDHSGRVVFVKSDGSKTNVFTLMQPNEASVITTEHYTIVEDERGHVWISTYGNGLYRYSIETGQLTHYRFTSNNQNNLIPGNTIQHIMLDRDGGLWVSAENSGISHIRVTDNGAQKILPETENTPGLYINDVKLITSGPEDNIMVSTRNGKVFLYDNKLQGINKVFTYDKNLYDYLYDPSGNQWYITRGDGLLLNGKKYVSEFGNSNSLSTNELFCILCDRKGRVWIGTFGGGLELVTIQDDGTPHFTHFLNESYGQRRIHALTEDSDGYIWAATSDGIYIFEPERLIKDPNDFYHYHSGNGALRSNEIKDIITDRRGDVWICESGVGFAICTPTKYDDLQFRHYGVSDGLVNPMVQAFLDVSPRQMWITTEYGVSCFNPSDGTFNNYFFSDDMPGNTYSQGSAMVLPDGRIALGTKAGINIIDPNSVRPDSTFHQTVFTNMYVNGFNVETNDTEYDFAVAYTPSVTLTSDQNSVKIDFSNLDFPLNSSHIYSYYLEGYDKGWSQPSNEPFAVYKKLAPGTYRLRVKAANINGTWVEDESIIEIKILPPWYMTWWAYLLYLLIAVLIGYIVYRNIRRINTLHNKIKLDQQLTDFKLTFFTNISHEFRTPLTLISGALQRMEKVENLPAETRTSMQVMDKSVKRMTRLINQVLEFRKMQRGKLSLSLVETDIIGFVREIFESFVDEAVAKKINYTMRVSQESFETCIDKGNLDKVIYNLISNALKYTLSGGSVTLTVDVLNASKEVVIKVIDTGVGIPEDKREQLFERFAHGSYAVDSMGIGLNLTYELVKVHHGSITYSENPHGGTIFTVVLPSDCSIYEKSDFVKAIPQRENSDEKTDSEISNAAPMPISGKDNGIEIASSEPRIIIESNTDGSEAEDTDTTLKTPGPLNNRRILVIEDDNDVRDFLRVELAPYFEVVTACDGIQGLEIAKNNGLDLVVCDVLMPGMNGFEVTSRLKNNFNTSHLPVILLTALGATDKHVEGIKSGADAYITKPFNTEILINRIFQLIEQRDHLRERYSTDPTVKAPILASNEKDKEFVEKLTSLVEEKLSDPDFSIDDFVSEMGVGRTIFFRKVKGLTGYAPKEFLRMYRMKKAAELLCRPDLNIAEVSYSVGIADPLYFSKCFKAQFGESPSTYRKNVAKRTKELSEEPTTDNLDQSPENLNGTNSQDEGNEID